MATVGRLFFISTLLLLLALNASVSTHALSASSCTSKSSSNSRALHLNPQEKQDQNANRRQIFQSAALLGAPWFIPPWANAAAEASPSPLADTTTKTPYLLPEYFQPPTTAPEYGRSYFPPLLPPLTQRATYLHKTNSNGKSFALEQLLAFQNVTASIRCQIFRLETGGLWVHSPLWPTGELCHLLDSLSTTGGDDGGGGVEHIILPCNALEHKAPMKAFIKKYPDAKVWISPGQYGPFGSCGIDTDYDSVKTSKSMGYRVDGILGDSMKVKPSWLKGEDGKGEFDMATLYVDIPQNAGPVSEVAFCHRPTKTLIATDAVVYIPEEAPPIFKTYFDAATINTDPTFWARSVLQAVFLPLRGSTNEKTGKPYYPGFTDALQNRLVRAPILRAFADARAPDAVREWVSKISSTNGRSSAFDFDRIVASHFASPIAATPFDFAACFSYLDKNNGGSSSSLPPITCRDWELLEGLNQAIADNKLGAPATFDYKEDCQRY